MAKNIGNLQDKDGNLLFPNGIETVTNSNGTALKFADGTMITFCRYEVKVNVVNPYGAGFYQRIDASLHFPVAFTDTPTISVTLDSGYMTSLVPNQVTESLITKFYAYCYEAESDKDIRCHIIAIGRWK